MRLSWFHDFLFKSFLHLAFTAVILSAHQKCVAGEETIAVGDPLQNLKPGEWFEVPNSHLEAVAASDKKFPWLSGGIGGITQCWAGGAFDSQRDRLYLGPGGGHAGYNGNEIYAFDLNDFKWHRLNDPDPVIPGTEYTDVNKAPFAMHTYDGVEYIPPPTDRYVVVGGWGTPRTYALDPDHPEKWEVYPDHGTGRTGDICAYDPIGGMLWLSTPSTNGKFLQWNPSTHLWTLRLGSSPHPSYYETADVDTKRSLFVSCGKGKVKTWTLRPTPQHVVAEEITTTGDIEILERASPGFCYVPLLDKFVAWANGPDVYTLDMENKKWTRQAPAASNKIIPGPADQWGTFGRFRYVASKNVFVVCNSVRQNIFIYRLTADKPNVITAVKATLIKNPIETNLPAAAISVEAIYADGSRKNVTEQASYFSLDSSKAEVDLHGRGVITGIADGVARIRAVYSDPAFKRGYSDELSIPIKDIVGQATLDSVQTNFPKLTLVAGDSFSLVAAASYTIGAQHFVRTCTDQATWSSDAPDGASVSKGMISAIRSGKPLTITASLNGKTATTQVVVVDAPVMERINFQLKDTPRRPGWKPDNGKPFTEQRGFGWLDAGSFTTRDDRDRAASVLLRGFVEAKEKRFKVKVPGGHYVVRIAMGDADYGAIPFNDWTALGAEKLLYDEGRRNSIATKIVHADDDGLLFTVKGKINYIVVAPVGVDIDKYADEGMGEGKR